MVSIINAEDEKSVKGKTNEPIVTGNEAEHRLRVMEIIDNNIPRKLQAAPVNTVDRRESFLGL